MGKAIPEGRLAEGNPWFPSALYFPATLLTYFATAVI